MKFFVSIVLTAFLAFVAGIYSTIPWWSFAVTSLIVAIAIHQKPGKAFLSGFLGLFLLWVGLSLFKDAANEHILSAKVAKILPLGGSYIALILVTGIIGGLVSGLSSVTGSYVKKSK
ncbi:MAG: hypothetical protein M0Q26_03390 [Chitinophagaceae bacterium]|nr:hypothetical protein [Chitinophagaceae bacterium]MDP1762945.1 hypothetical protein [Sediminibacterium sp.]MDP1812645.1 hypothetical protein [Sediminibacterium sp.]MDP3127532.1 hypothetical protein [Sediminibacterium sp.]MDP3667422.1 hypothetical protein [Sediminibacterium sp.]